MYITSTSLAAVPKLVHGFFTRKGGVSTGIFAELNCGGWNTAEKAAIVDENRRLVAEVLGFQAANLLSVQQVHGSDVVTVKNIWDMSARPRADAMVTQVPGIGLGILSADCAPVLFVDGERQVIGAAHSGWKGAFSGVLESTILAMEHLGAQRENMLAAIGPTIAQSSYEVDKKFRERFLYRDPSYVGFFTAMNQHGHSHFDLPAYVQHRLTQAGIRTIDRLPNDTYQEAEQFYSYRRATHRGESDYGRQISVIGLAL